jgi:hypothetical protein
LIETDVVFLKKMFNNSVDLDPLHRIQLNYRSARYGRGVTLCPPFARTSQYQDGFYCRAVKLYNRLENGTKNIRSMKSFQKQLRESIAESKVDTS